MQQADLDWSQLWKVLEKDRRVLQYHRQCRVNAVREYAGANWAWEGSRQDVPINLLSLYISIVGRQLIAKSPRVMLSTFRGQYKPTVNAMQEWGNQEIERTKLANVFQRWVLDGLFSFGILKVALADPPDAALYSWNLRAGYPFASCVDLDDFVVDTHARTWEEVSYIGHRIRRPLLAVKESSIYTKARKELQASVDLYWNQGGDEKISHLGRGNFNQDEFEDMVELWELYLPRHRLVVTLPGAYQAHLDEPLRVQKWIGPESGPYHILSFGTVPGNLIPKGPVADLIDLHILANDLYNKLADQARRQKTNLYYASQASGDASQIQDSYDGQVIKNDNPERIKEVATGGPSQINMQFFADVVLRFSYMAGNLDMAGGLSPQSKTLGQDRMLAESASGTIKDKQDITVRAVSEAMEALFWFWHHDPLHVMQTTHSLQGMPEFNINRIVSPSDRGKIPFEELGLKIDAYSMQAQTPQSRAESLVRMVQTIVAPMMQQMQAQGVSFDMNTFLQKLGSYWDMPDLQEVLTIREPVNPGQQGGDMPGMPPQTERTYNRVSMPGRTQQGNQMNMMSALAGVDPGGAANGETNGKMP